MNRFTEFFLTILAPLFSIALAWLGWLSLKTNLLGWFLLVAGLGFSLGVIVRYWILHDRYWNPRTGSTFTSEERGDRSFWMIIPGLAIPFFLAPVEYLALPALLPRPPILQWAGAGLVMISWILFGEARRRIRASYSGHLGVSASQKLVQSGPYALVRHPAYLSFLLMAAGFSLGYSSLIGLLAIPILLAPGLAYRIRVEESLLEAHFEEEWRGYASRTRRLIPWVW